jgi:MFS family permease
MPLRYPRRTSVREGRTGAAAWWTLGVLVAISLFAFIDRQVLSLVAAPLAADLKLSDTQLGALQGLGLAIFATLFTYPLGWLADRFDRRAVLGFCILVWAGGTAACGLGQGFIQLFLATVAVAAGEAGLAPLVLSAIPDLFEGHERTKANLVYYVATGLGISLGFGLGGMMIGALEPLRSLLPETFARLESWRLAFMIVAAPAPLFLVLVATARLDRRTRRGKPVAAPAVTPIIPYVRAHLGTLVLMFGSVAAFLFAFGGIIGWIPVALTRIWGLSPTQDGLGMGIATAAGTVVGTLAAWVLMRRFGSSWGPAAPLRLGVYAMLVVAPTLILSALAVSPWQLLALVGCQFAAGTVVGALLPNMLQDMAPAPLRGRIFAIYAVLSTPTSGLSIIAVGGLSDVLRTGPRDVLFAIAIAGIPAWILGAVLLHFAQRPFKRTVEIVRYGTLERSAPPASAASVISK